MRADIVPGGTFPDYELTDHTRTRLLREAWEAGDHTTHYPYKENR